MPLLPPYDSRLHKEEAGLGRHKAQITPPETLSFSFPIHCKGVHTATCMQWYELRHISKSPTGHYWESQREYHSAKANTNL